MTFTTVAGGEALPATDFSIATDFGRVEFPSSPKAPAKWVKLSPDVDDASMAELVRLMIKAWRLPTPSVIISVTGGAGGLELNDKQKLVFRRGLLQAARRASTGGNNEDGEIPMAPWIFSGGTNSGVMELVGRAMQGLDSDVYPTIPCIGVAPWGIISQRQHMASSNAAAAAAAGGRSGAPIAVGGGDDDGGAGVLGGGGGGGGGEEEGEDGGGAAAPAHQAGGATPRAPTQQQSGSKKRSRLGYRYVYGSKADPPEYTLPAATARRRRRKRRRRANGTHRRNVAHGLDANHSHFLLVDSGKEGVDAYGTELEVRSALTGYICRR